MARLLEIDFNDVDWPMGDAAGYGTRAMPIKELLNIENKMGRPAMVYIHADAEEEDVREAEEKTLFGSDDLAMASHFFSVFRIAINDIDDKNIAAEFAKKLPVLIFLDGEGKEVSTAAGKTNAKVVHSNLGKAFQATYGLSMGKQLQLFSEHLDRTEKVEDKLADVQKRVEEMRARVDRRETANAKDNLKEEEAKLAALKAEMQKLGVERDQILNPEPKKPTKEVATTR